MSLRKTTDYVSDQLRLNQYEWGRAGALLCVVESCQQQVICVLLSNIHVNKAFNVINIRFFLPILIYN